MLSPSSLKTRRIVRPVKKTFSAVGTDDIFSCSLHSWLLLPRGGLFRWRSLNWPGALYGYIWGGTSCDTSSTRMSTRFLSFLGTCSSSFRRNLRGQLCHDCPGMKQRKAQLIKARVSTNMKRGIDDLAHQRGESEAVIVREALSQYLSKSAILLGSSPSYRPKKRN